MAGLTLGTRGSKLALAQAHLVIDALRTAHPSLDVQLRIIKTAGDKAQDKSLSEIGGAGVFVKEIEQALLRGEIDMAVHSAKDLPSQLPDGLTIAACLPRGDARDALVMRAGTGWASATNDNPFVVLPHGAKVGTGSVRRAAFIRSHRPDVIVQDIRGNVDSRLQRLLAGEFDALVLATAGLERLAHIADGNVRVMPIPMEHMLPAVAQGTLAVEAREDDAQVLALLKLIDHRDTHATLIAERAFLRAFDAGCQAPVAAHARIAGNRICLRGAVGLPDGSAFAQGERERPADQAEVVGATLAQRVLKAGGHTILNVMRDGTRPLSGWRIILTRASARGESLAVKLRALGATPVNLPVITHAPPVDPLALDGALLALCNGAYDWVAFTSVTAIEAVTARLDALACAWPAGARMAVVGEATAQMCEDALGRAPDCMPEHFDALSLARAMAAMHEFDRRRVLLPNADIAPATLQNALQALGMQVDRVTAYRTVCCDAPDSSSAMPANAIVFTSSSTVACFASQFAERRAIAVCIGRQTAHAAAGAGFERIVTAATATEDGLIDALLRIANEG